MSTKYSDVQKANCVLWLAESKDIPTVQKNFHDSYPTFPAPSGDQIRIWYGNFKESGSYDSVITEEPKHVDFDLSNGTNGVEEKKDLHKDPSGVDLHSADFEKDTGLLNFFGFRTVHKCHPYKMHLKGKLDQETSVKRKQFAKHELGRIHAIPHLSRRIWFGGEATFYTNGRVACHNLVYLAEDCDDPASKQSPPPEGPCVTVWAALNYEGLLGPYISNGPADKHSYNLFVRKFCYEVRQIQRLKMRVENQIFVHDDSPIHDDQETAEFLYQEFPYYWVGPGSKYMEFPKMSPDLNPLDFFLWGHIKKLVYETPIKDGDVTELGHRIHHAFTEIIPEMMEAAVRAYKKRLEMVVESDGDLVEVHDDDENKMSYLDYGAMPYYIY